MQKKSQTLKSVDVCNKKTLDLKVVTFQLLIIKACI